MKKIVKYSLFGLIYLVIIFFLAAMFIATAKADLVKPNNSIEPYQVVKIQLRSLKQNDKPKERQWYRANMGVCTPKQPQIYWSIREVYWYA